MSDPYYDPELAARNRIAREIAEMMDVSAMLARRNGNGKGGVNITINVQTGNGATQYNGPTQINRSPAYSSGSDTIVRFDSPQEATAFIDWLNFRGITRGDMAAAIESDFQAAQEFFGTALLKFRAERQRRIALDRWLDFCESEVGT